MALISFDPSINQQIEDRNNAIAGKASFDYPTSDQQFQFDELNKLLPFSWDGIDAPLLELQTTYSRDVVSHKFVNVGGAKLEDTGRNPIMISAQIVFVNTISPGGNEGWTQGTLYPNVYNQYLMSLLNSQDSQTTRILSHPELGDINCKVITFSTQLIGNYRGGAIISAQFSEDGLDNSRPQTLFVQLSKINNNIVTLQDQLANLSPDPLALQLQPVALGLTGLLNSIKAIIDTGALIGLDALGSLQQISYRCNTIIESVHLANNMIYAKVQDTAYMVRADSVYMAEALKKSIPIQANQKTSIYINKTITTLASLAQLLANSVSDLMNLNPQLLATPLVASGNQVVYYTGKTQISPQLPSI